MILVHSSGLGGRQWSKLLNFIPDAIALDLTGYGSVEFDPDRAALEQDTEVVCRHLSAAGEPVYLVGHSYGGLVALSAAHAMADQVAGLILFEPVLIDLLDGELSNHMEKLVQDLENKRRSGEEVQGLRAFVDFWSGSGAFDSMSERLRDAMIAVRHKIFSEIESTSSKVECEAPVPVWSVASDTCRPEAEMMCRRLAELNQSTMLRSPGGHMSPVTHPQAAAELILSLI